MRSLNSREKVILIITVALFFIYLACQFVIKPVHEGAVDVDEQLRVDRVKLANLRQILSQKEAIEDRYKKLTERIASSDSDDVQMPAIIAKIETAARDSNIHIVNIQPQKSTFQEGYKFLAVELEMDGRWVDIVQFLFLLQQKPNFYFLDELNLEKYSDNASLLRGRIVVSKLCLIASKK